MQELFEQIKQLIRGAWRFRWRALSVALGVCLFGWIVIGLQKDVFEAKTRVFVDTKSQLRALLNDQIVEINLEDRLRFVREALLGREQLLRLARETGLDEGIETPDQEQYLVDVLARTIIVAGASDLDIRRTRNAVRTDDTYTITYQHTDKQVAVDVVRTLLDIFVEDTIQAKRESQSGTGEFLAEQLADYEEQLRNAEQRLANFKRENVHRMPSQQGDYFDRIQESTDELDSARQELRLAESRLESIELQLRGEAPRVAPTEAPDPNSLEGRILENETRLDDLKMRYTDSHPDVIAAQEIVDGLRRRQAEAYAAMGDAGGQSVSSNNPVFQALQISRNEIAAEVATLRANVTQRERKVEELKSLINEMPEVEAELARLNRDYEVVYTQYQSLLDSYQRERLTREVVENEAVQFRIIDPPVAGLKPVSPPRAMLMSLILIVALGIGAGTAYLKDQLQPMFQSQRSLDRSFGIPVIGTVARVLSADVRQDRFRMISLFMAAGIGLVIFNVILIIFEVYGGGIRNFVY